MASQRQTIRDLQNANRELRVDLARAQDQAKQSFERQLLIACLLERLATDGACILPLDLRQMAMSGSWGYETMIVQSEDDHPMVIRLLKGAHSGT